MSKVAVELAYELQILADDVAWPLHHGIAKRAFKIASKAWQHGLTEAATKVFDTDMTNAATPEDVQVALLEAALLMVEPLVESAA